LHPLATLATLSKVWLVVVFILFFFLYVTDLKLNAVYWTEVEEDL
jgi:hypothetical protein